MVPVMAKHAIEALAVVPTFVEGLENMNDLGFAQAVQMGNHRVEFVGHVFLFVGFERAVVYADSVCPS